MVDGASGGEDAAIGKAESRQFVHEPFVERIAGRQAGVKSQAFVVERRPAALHFDRGPAAGMGEIAARGADFTQDLRGGDGPAAGKHVGELPVFFEVPVLRQRGPDNDAFNEHEDEGQHDGRQNNLFDGFELHRQSPR